MKLFMTLYYIGFIAFSKRPSQNEFGVLFDSGFKEACSNFAKEARGFKENTNR